MKRRSTKILFLGTLRPLYALIVAFGLLMWFPPPWPAEHGQMLGAALTVGSVVMGFLISAQAIIVSSSSRAMEHVRQLDLMPELRDNFSVAVIASMSFSVVSCVGFFDPPPRVFHALWMALGISMLYSFKRICSILFRLSMDSSR